MEEFVSHWGASVRRFPSLFALQTLGYLPAKTNWVRTAFSTCNFSFIITGRGRYLRSGLWWTVEAPAVICQWPGDYLEYGPTGAEGTWEELFLIFRPEAMEDFRRCGFVEEDRPCWKIAQEERWREGLAEFLILARKQAGGQADRVDRFSEKLILESLLSVPPEDGESRELGVVLRIQQTLRSDLARTPDFATEARRHGLSDSTFRRRWRQTGEPPPAQFLARLRLQEACRRLVETDFSVGEIAAAVGFEDALYFSRKFRDQTGMSATQYRRAYRA